MSIHEFEIIEKYFNQVHSKRSDVHLGIGDDAALLQVPEDKLLAVSTDTLVQDVHFPKDTSPEAIAHKSLAVNLSDLAAMGAEPAWATMNLTLPESNEIWLQQFCDSFFNLANRYSVNLVGGDLTKGPLTISVTIYGFVSKDKVLTRANAKAGDKVFVSGSLGDAGAALMLLKQNQSVPKALLKALELPTPKLELGQFLSGIAHAAIDISDGFIADLHHILKASQVGAAINIDKLPLSKALLDAVSLEAAQKLALSSGDDYQLCFTISAKNAARYQSALEKYRCVCIGTIDNKSGLRLINEDGSVCSQFINTGYQHF